MKNIHVYNEGIIVPLLTITRTFGEQTGLPLPLWNETV